MQTKKQVPHLLPKPTITEKPLSVAVAKKQTSQKVEPRKRAQVVPVKNFSLPNSGRSGGTAVRNGKADDNCQETADKTETSCQENCKPGDDSDKTGDDNVTNSK